MQRARAGHADPTADRPAMDRDVPRRSQQTGPARRHRRPAQRAAHPTRDPRRTRRRPMIIDAHAHVVAPDGFFAYRALLLADGGYHAVKLKIDVSVFVVV